jgi:hypothetical protein
MSKAAIATMPKNNFLILNYFKIKHEQGFAAAERFCCQLCTCVLWEVQCCRYGAFSSYFPDDHRGP